MHKNKPTNIFIQTCILLFLCTLPLFQAGYGSASDSGSYGSSLVALSSPSNLLENPTPTLGPQPEYVNLKGLLTVAGPYTNFLKHLESTNLIKTLQAQANDTKEGITLFVPDDDAFTNLKKPSLSNLTSDQLKRLCLFHVLPHYYTLSDFKKLSVSGPINTLAGGSDTLNITGDPGLLHIGSGWTKANVSSSVHDKYPVAIFEVNKVLLPQAIFGTNIPLVADGGKGKGKDKVIAANSSTPSSSYRIFGRNRWMWAVIVAIHDGLVLIL